MASGETTEALSQTPKKFCCSCGLLQKDRKKLFSGKCKHCHTRPKYLRTQCSFGSGSTSLKGDEIPSSAMTATSAHPNETLEIVSLHSTNSTSRLATARSTVPSSTLLLAQSSAGTTESTSLPLHSSRCQSASPSASYGKARPNLALAQRKSRSADTYDLQQLLAEGARGGGPNRRNVYPGVRRTESEDTSRTSAERKNSKATPPPSSDEYQNTNLISHDDAVANQDSSFLKSQGFSKVMATSSDMIRPSSVSLGHSGHPSSSLANIDTLNEIKRVSARESATAAEKMARGSDTRSEEKETRLKEEKRMKKKRLKELQLSQHSGCPECMKILDDNDSSSDDQMNDGGAYPMEALVVLQDAGLLFCSIL